MKYSFPAGQEMAVSSFHGDNIIHKETAEPASITVPENEVYRYLGYRGVKPSPEISAKIEMCITTMVSRSRLRAAWLAAPQRENAQAGDCQNCHIRFADLDIESRALARNLKGCDVIVMMAATIGPGIDFLIRRSETSGMLEAAIYQAAGAAYVEAWCDEVNARVVQFMKGTGRSGRPRFSPGYGDLPLVLQKDFSRILNMPANCGISLTDTLLMTPSKSVTAFIGFAAGDELQNKNDLNDVSSGCAACGAAATCEFRH